MWKFGWGDFVTVSVIEWILWSFVKHRYREAYLTSNETLPRTRPGLSFLLFLSLSIFITRVSPHKNGLQYAGLQMETFNLDFLQLSKPHIYRNQLVTRSRFSIVINCWLFFSLVTQYCDFLCLISLSWTQHIKFINNSGSEHFRRIYYICTYLNNAYMYIFFMHKIYKR